MKRFLLAVCCAITGFTLFAQGIIIEKDARAANPTASFKGVSGNETASAAVRRSLQFCGWLDVTNQSGADYVISGTASDTDITLRISNSAGAEIATVSASGHDAVDTAHAGVDAVLKSLFNVPGLCRTKIVFTAATGKGRKELLIADFDGRNVQQITKNGVIAMDPVWAPDGKSLIYSYVGHGTSILVQYNMDTKLSRKLSNYKGLNAGGAISPDGRKIALVLNRNNQVDLFLRDLEGGALTRLTNDGSVEASPCWSPDGTKICYVSDMAGSRPQLFLIDARAGARAQRISGLNGSEKVAPSWNRDGKLTYSAKIGGDYVVCVASLNGAKASMEKIGMGNLNDALGEGPSWAPDGRHVVVAFKGRIFIVDTWLGKRRQLFSGKTITGQPEWSPILK